MLSDSLSLPAIFHVCFSCVFAPKFMFVSWACFHCQLSLLSGKFIVSLITNATLIHHSKFCFFDICLLVDRLLFSHFQSFCLHTHSSSIHPEDLNALNNIGKPEKLNKRFCDKGCKILGLCHKKCPCHNCWPKCTHFLETT